MTIAELENSSLQTSVPEAILGRKLWLATPLPPAPAEVAMALILRLEATKMGAW